ncbi:MAG: flagellar protein FliT [Gammaproteobacteria bacterium]|nr:MAG: flagellar protein FliT [Gammaproteobacteria bacterium]
MFFSSERLHFFKPLTSKYREQIVQCLCLLYQSQFSSTADYGHALDRDQVVEILTEALARSSSVVLDEVEDQEPRFRNNRDLAAWVLKQLVEFGWIEKQVDTTSLQSTFPFTRMGRLFVQSLVESDGAQIRTRHRNTRNTLNALEAFVSRGEIYDLLDAYEYSERIITDFTDVISELDEKKRELAREVEGQQLVHQASEQFFDYMEKRFQPDIQVRLSADSVEKHREDIHKVIRKIRRKNKEFKADAERALRRTVPNLCANQQSYLLFTLEKIEQRMSNAAEVMLPALRRALHSFTKRADIIIRQLSYLNVHQNNDLLDICKELSELNDQDFSVRLDNAAQSMSGFKIKLIDPNQIKLQETRQKQLVDSSVIEDQVVDQEVLRELMIQQMLDQAFMVNNSHVREYIMTALRGGQRISTRELPIDDAKQLLAMAHVIEVGTINSLSSDLLFDVQPTGNRITESEYFQAFDEFTIELMVNHPTQSQD